jgi:hypothetical protein
MVRVWAAGASFSQEKNIIKRESLYLSIDCKER